MTREEFEQLVATEFPLAVPERFQHLIQNVAFLVDAEPSAELRAQEGLQPGETLLGLYHGVSVTARGDNYGIGGTLPDTITLFQKPIEEVAKEEAKEVGQVIRETIWHEVAHHFGYDEKQIREREHDGKDFTE
jgi:predicted Zn-dependent protease with MMP-like domain